MSQNDGHSESADAELDRIDGLISAAMDDELDLESREALRRLMAEDDSLAARVRAFHRVDAGLRGLGADPDVDARLATNFEALSERIGESGTAEDGPLVWLRSRALPVWVAAAAALAFYLAVMASSPLSEEGFAPTEEVADRPAAREQVAPDARGSESGPVQGLADRDARTDEMVEAALDSEIEDGLVWALGYLDDPNQLDAQSVPLIEDFEIIEQLELLDFLNARDALNSTREGQG